MSRDKSFLNVGLTPLFRDLGIFTRTVVRDLITFTLRSRVRTIYYTE